MLDDLELILRHPEFFRIERCHRTLAPSLGEFRYQVGIGLLPNQVLWFDDPTLDIAVARAAEAIRRVAAGEHLRVCVHCDAPHFEPQGLCAACNRIDVARKMFPGAGGPRIRLLVKEEPT